jgi:hypothetical protein
VTKTGPEGEQERGHWSDSQFASCSPLGAAAGGKERKPLLLFMLPPFINPKEFKNPNKQRSSPAIVSGSNVRNRAATGFFGGVEPILVPEQA